MFNICSFEVVCNRLSATAIINQSPWSRFNNENSPGVYYSAVEHHGHVCTVQWRNKGGVVGVCVAGQVRLYSWGIYRVCFSIKCENSSHTEIRRPWNRIIFVVEIIYSYDPILIPILCIGHSNSRNHCIVWIVIHMSFSDFNIAWPTRHRS